MYNRSGNAVFSLNYHLVIVVKYRRNIFVSEDIISDLKQLVLQIANNHNVEIISQECGNDHIHILFCAKPTCDIPKFINSLKGYTSRVIREQYHSRLSDKLWGDALWSPSYFIATAGNVSLAVLNDYINKQRETQ